MISTLLRRAVPPLAALMLAALAPVDVAAQASPYLPLDDPRLPLIEHLIARGDIADPSPMVRPFRRADALRVLAARDSADRASGSAGSALVRELRASLEERVPGEERWAAEARAGFQAYSSGRRDDLHPAGPGDVQPYGDLRLEALVGPIALVSRPAAEPRLIDDPDWPGRPGLKFTGRMVEAYASAQFRWGSVFYGLMDRNWGPVGLPGIPLSDVAYPRTEFGFDVGTRVLRLQASARDLRDQTDSAGQPIHRYFFAHRLGLRLSDRLNVGLWETAVLGGPDRSFDGRFRNPLSLLLLANQYGQGDDANALVGLDLDWRVLRRVRLQAQLAVDDIQYQNRSGPNRYPDRYAFTLAAYGPAGRTLGWSAFYTRASSLAFRTLDPVQNFTDAGVGLGRNFDDMDQVTVRVSLPWRNRWLLTPEATLLRQGQGNINDPFPATAAEAGQLPQIFIGTIERTWRLALLASGREGPFDLQGSAGINHVTNAGHVPGVSDNRFQGRVQATLRIGARGSLH